MAGVWIEVETPLERRARRIKEGHYPREIKGALKQVKHIDAGLMTLDPIRDRMRAAGMIKARAQIEDALRSQGIGVPEAPVMT